MTKVWIHPVPPHLEDIAYPFLEEGYLCSAKNLQMEQGDSVYIPHLKTFSIFKVMAQAFPVSEYNDLEYFMTWNKDHVFRNSAGFLQPYESVTQFDVAFLVPVRFVLAMSYAESGDDLENCLKGATHTHILIKNNQYDYNAM